MYLPICISIVSNHEGPHCHTRKTNEVRGKMRTLMSQGVYGGTHVIAHFKQPGLGLCQCVVLWTRYIAQFGIW